MNCPKCGAAMSKLDLPSGAEIDTCEAHGVWLDVGELERIVQFQAQRVGGGRGRAAPQQPSMTSRVVGGVVSGVAHGAGAGLASGLIRRLFR